MIPKIRNIAAKSHEAIKAYMSMQSTYLSKISKINILLELYVKKKFKEIPSFGTFIAFLLVGLLKE
ncbi:MAG: hypothetical protein ACPGU8_03215 [Methylophilaceae bacterium]